VWNEGRPSACGISVNEIVRAPLAITRSVSATVASMSQYGTNASGIWRPGFDAHHSSIIQSFHATTHAVASSLSGALKNVLPANPGKLGKQSWAWTPSMSMSATRSAGV
jgi:hypothetical protein